MNRFSSVLGLGLGLGLGGGLIYGFFISEGLRLLAVGLGAFLLATLTIGGTALLVNRQWTRALGNQRISHHHRYPTQQRPPAIWDASFRTEPPDSVLPRPETLPTWPMVNLSQPNEEDEIVA